MKQYLDIVKHVLENGKEKSPVRRNSDGDWEPVDGGVKTLACPNVLFSHDMKEGFPLLTTKKMAVKAICVELEGFIKGITDKKWYQERGCKIWNEWCNPKAKAVGDIPVSKWPSSMWINWNIQDEPNADEIILNERKRKMKEINDLGPIYGYQWRTFDQRYTKYSGVDPEIESYPIEQHDSYNKQSDQLANIVQALQENPMDRRMVCSAWNPNQIHMMALPPCHWGWNVTVIGDELNLFWVQRSCDLMLGVPFNIASYGLLLCLLAKVGGFKTGNLSGMLVDCHIYENQIEAAKEQIKRDPQPLPRIGINRYMDNRDFDIFNWSHEDVVFLDYNPLDKIDFGKVVV